MRRVLGLAILVVFSLVFLYRLYSVILSRDPGGLPATVLSRVGSRPQESEGAILLMRESESVIPRGASVVFVRPDQRNANLDRITFLVALGHLPRHRVLPARVLDEGGGGPDFVVTFLQGDFVDPRFELVRSFEHGKVFRRL